MVRVRVRCVINKIWTESKSTLKSCLLFYYSGIIFDPIKGFGRVCYELKHTVVALNASDVHMLSRFDPRSSKKTLTLVSSRWR